MTKIRITLSLDSDLAAAVDVLSYPTKRSTFVNALLKESLELLEQGKVNLGDLRSPLLRRQMANRGDSYGGVGYA